MSKINLQSGILTVENKKKTKATEAIMTGNGQLVSNVGLFWNASIKSDSHHIDRIW